jgi:hypothetical protein
MPRYVVQQHFRDEEDWHFDLMLEAAGALVTFSSHTPPEAREALPCLVRHLGDHRLAYLEYEGEISGGRGWCRIHDRGSLEWLEPTDPALLPSADEIRIRLAGEKADGTFQLVREPASGTDYWRLRRVTE